MTWQEKKAGHDDVYFSIDWGDGATGFVTNTTYSIKPVISRWDRQSTDNYGSSWAESLNPNTDSGGTGYWDGLRYPSGSSTASTYRVIDDTWTKRTYSKGHFARTLTYRLYTDSMFGTWVGGDVGFERIGEVTLTFTLTIPALASYSVKYYKNTDDTVGSMPSSQTKWYGESLTLSNNTPTRTGYTFKGWATSSSGSVAYAKGASYATNAALNLYAVWQANTYSITYDANGHGTAPSSQTKTYGVSITLRGSMGTVGNYVFKNWNTAANGSGTSYSAGASYTGNSTLSLHAQWYAPYTITYKPNGASGANQTQTKLHGTGVTVKAATTFTRTNYVFRNWNTKSDGSGTSYSAGSSYSANASTDLYAQWYAPYTITYNANGGSGAPSAGTKVYNTAYTVSSTVPTRSGYSFTGWNTSSSGSGTSYSSGGTIAASVNQNVTLYAQWSVAHEKPSITKLLVQRCDSSGNLKDDGTCCKVTAAATIYRSTGYTSTTLQNVKIKVGSFSEVTLTSSSSSVTVTTSSSAATVAVSYVYTANAVSTGSSYQVTLTVNDTAGFSSSLKSTLSIAFFTMHFKAGGTGVGIGRMATANNQLAVGIAARFDDTVSAYSDVVQRDNVLNITSATNGLTDDLSRQYAFRDKNGYNAGTLQLMADTSGNVTMRIYAQHKVNDDWYINQIRLDLAADGTRTVMVSSPAAWRSALGLGTAATHADSDFQPAGSYAASTHYHGYLYNGATSSSLHRMLISDADNIRVENRADTSSTWSTYGYAAITSSAPSNSSQQTANRVLATPNGSNGLPSIRALVAADIPDLSSTYVKRYDVKTKDISSSVSVATSTYKSIGSVSLEAGTWLIVYGTRYAAGSGTRCTYVKTTADSDATAKEYRETCIQSAAAGEATFHRGSCIVQPTATTSYYLSVWHNTGSSLSVTGNIKAIRLG